MRSLAYPLPALTLTERQCDKIMRPVLQTILPKMGINQKMARLYMYDPQKYQGLVIPNIYTEMGISRIMLFMKHGNRDT